MTLQADTSEPRSRNPDARHWLLRSVGYVVGYRWVAAAAMLLFLALCVPIGRSSYGLVNHDAISYLSLADHLLQGRPDLSVSGAWSPLFVWLLAGLQSLGIAQDSAMRVAMALSGAVFLAGCLCYYHRAGSLRIAIAAAMLTAFSAALFTGSLATPDLMSAGLLLLGWRCLAGGCHIASAIAAGLLFGTAFLAKAIMLPVAVAGTIVLVIVTWLGTAGAMRRAALLRHGIAMLALALVALPWVVTLSVKYHQVTLTRSSMPQWQVLNPPQLGASDQPTNIQFVVPEPGRQSQFEDETFILRPPWSPLEKKAYLVHYIRHLQLNVGRLPQSTGVFDMLGLGLVGMLFFGAAAIAMRLRGDPEPLARWPGIAIPATLLTGAYLLNWSGEPRYHLILLPVIILASLHLWTVGGRLIAGRIGSRVTFALGLLVLIVSALGILRLQLAMTPSGRVTPDYRAITAELKKADMVAPLAIVGHPPIERPGAVLSFLLGAPWHGTQVVETLEESDAACARLLLVPRSEPIMAAFEVSPLYRPVGTISPRLATLIADQPFEIYWRRDASNWRRPCNNARTLIPR